MPSLGTAVIAGLGLGQGTVRQDLDSTPQETEPY